MLSTNVFPSTEHGIRKAERSRPVRPPVVWYGRHSEALPKCPKVEVSLAHVCKQRMSREGNNGCHVQRFWRKDRRHVQPFL